MCALAIMKDIKRFMGYYYNDTYGWIEKPKYTFQGREIPSHIKVVVGKVLMYITESNFISGETQKYLKSPESSMRSFAYSLYEEDKSKNPNTVLSKISYDRRKIISYLGDNFITDILLGKIEPKAAENILAAVAYKYESNNEFRDAFIAKLPDTGKIVRELSDEDFDLFISIIEPYTKRKYEASKRFISEDMIGYFNFLSLGNSISETDERRLTQIRAILFGRESK